jgi:hypothetical protein
MRIVDLERTDAALVKCVLRSRLASHAEAAKGVRELGEGGLGDILLVAGNHQREPAHRRKLNPDPGAARRKPVIAR